MNRPPTKTMVMGHPAIAVPLMLVGGITLLAAFHAGNLLIGIFAVAILLTVQKASEEASAYRQWKSEWDAMAGLPPPRRRKPIWGRMIALALALMLFAVMRLGGASTSDAAICIGLLVGVTGTIAIVLRLAIRCFKWRRPIRATKSGTVKVVAKTILPVPTLKAAYAMLPDHCQQVLRQ